MKFIIEANIPYIKGIFEPYAEVEYLAPEAFNNEAIKDADAIIVRTRTHCNAELLENTKCKFVGTATIGTDHIDLDWCKNNGVTVINAPGCNAPAVAQYVISTVGRLMKIKGVSNPADITIGIVGVGHVGTIISHWAKAIGFKVLENDPPRQRAEGGNFVSLATIAKEADVITFHTPFTKEGIDKTLHLCDENFINSLQRSPLLINSSRGPVIDNNALENAMRNGKIEYIALDCWEGEPNINSYLLEKAYVATPHIAGYSSEGKQRATDMMIEAVAKHFDLPLKVDKVDMGNNSTPSLNKVIDSYDPQIDTSALKKNPENFEALRNHYNLRHEVQ